MRISDERAQLIRTIAALVDQLEKLNDESPRNEPGREKGEILNLYFPRGLHNLYKLPKPML